MTICNYIQVKIDKLQILFSAMKAYLKQSSYNKHICSNLNLFVFTV